MNNANTKAAGPVTATPRTDAVLAQYSAARARMLEKLAKELEAELEQAKPGREPLRASDRNPYLSPRWRRDGDSINQQPDMKEENQDCCEIVRKGQGGNYIRCTKCMAAVKIVNRYTSGQFRRKHAKTCASIKEGDV